VILPLGIGLLLSSGIGLVGYWRGSLSRGGVVGAIITGTPVFGFGGIVWAMLLVAFFLSSSALSQYRARPKALLADKFQKGSRRDLMQALANGGWAALLAVMFGVWHLDAIFIAFIGTMATVTADTWATEVGVLSRQSPRLITSGRTVPAGTSGGVTLLGTTAASLGAAFIGVCGSLVVGLVVMEPRLQVGGILYEGSAYLPATLISLAFAGGLCGSLFDSFLGATVQAIYFCDADQKETEKRIHSCGRKTRLVRGQRWLDNDAVNFLSSIFGSVLAVLIGALVLPSF
jgi:uncharacterized protein (TIGR00297 family)